MDRKVAPKRPAFNARSPHRRHRWRSQARIASVEGRKKVFLERIMAGDTQGQASDYVNTNPRVIWGWMKTDPAFTLSYHQARTHALEAARENLEGLQPKAVRVVDRAMDDEVDLKLSSDVALKVLKGQGLLVDRSESSVSGVILSITGDELARIYRASRSAFLQASGEPVGVANGGGDGERPAAGSGANQVPAVAPPAPGAPGD